MLLTRDSHYLFFGSGCILHPDQISKFSVNKKEVVAKFGDPAFENGISCMALSPDSNSLYVGTHNKLLQLSLKDGKVINSTNINESPGMEGATIQSMRVTRNNQYLVTGTTCSGTPEKGSGEELSGRFSVSVGGPVFVWSTKDLILVKT
jgi:hypothetical protein